MSVISIDIQPENESIHLFTGENMIPNETITLKGHVQLTLLRPIQIRQITIQLKGTVRNIISNDILRSTEPLIDENDAQLWPVAVLHHNSNIPLMDRMTRRALNAAMGYASASQTIIREQIHLFNNSENSDSKSLPIISLEAGITRYPFELTIHNADQLPPSILLPRHSISYELSAKLRLASFREIAKITYWNARSSASFSFLTTHPLKNNNSNHHDNATTTTDRRFSRSSSSSVSTQESTSRRHHHNINNNASRLFISSSTSTASPSSTTSQEQSSVLVPQQEQQQQQQTAFSKQKQKLLRTIKPIHVFCHGHGSLQILEYQQRIRYRGCRERHLKYEVSMTKYLCLQKKKFDLVCHFTPLREEASIAWIEAYLEQTEKYPLRAGRIREYDPLPPEILVSKSSRPIIIKRSIDPEQDDVSHIPLSLPVHSPHIAQDIDTFSLKITHKIRVIVHFRNPEIRKMSLSFPVIIGTVPVNHGGGMTLPTIVVQQQQLLEEQLHQQGGEIPDAWDHSANDDDWIHIISNADQTQRSRDNNYDHLPEKLPSYYEVLHEGAPPAAFIDDDLSHYPSPHI
ncbi:hypothetical protein BDA99DRAFT_560722 [Phascolomyces articulosus]|uniref:Uncharacterized protein n=1 Tax=Phascolomyces articulosus TaxID=60185 RepID=A0AAD5JYN3_9FUNG|nr:hypothetical protein BDA99DRAFT_560722 [Phascolomyces articulosus]